MSHKRKGQLADSNEWRKHLRPLFRRFYWKRERVAEKNEIKSQLRDLLLKPSLVGLLGTSMELVYVRIILLRMCRVKKNCW